MSQTLSCAVNSFSFPATIGPSFTSIDILRYNYRKRIDCLSKNVAFHGGYMVLTIKKKPVKFSITSDSRLEYPDFCPQLYNLVINEFRFRKNETIVSKAFCSDENQGGSTLHLCKNFGVYPFNHGRVGATVALDRNGPFSHHGKDLVIVAASHVGFDEENHVFGTYRRPHCGQETFDCGMLVGTIADYLTEYEVAKKTINLVKEGKKYFVIIKTQLIHNLNHKDDPYENGEPPRLLLKMNRIVQSLEPVEGIISGQKFLAADSLVEKLGKRKWTTGKGNPIGDELTAELFTFRQIPENHITNAAVENLQKFMNYIVSSKFPSLTAAVIQCQEEYGRTVRSIQVDPFFFNRDVFFVAGIHIDQSPKKGQIVPFPNIEFVPYAALLKKRDGRTLMFDQQEVLDLMKSQSTINENAISLNDALKSIEKDDILQIDDIELFT